MSRRRTRRWLRRGIVRGRLISDLYRLRTAIAAATLVMGSGIAIGYVLHEPGATTAGGTPYAFEDPSAVDIAVNNLLVLVALVGGALTLGGLTISGLLYNGFVLGTVASSLDASGRSVLDVAVLIVPHATFELAGLLLGAVVGLAGGANVVRYLLGARRTVVTGAELRRGARLLGVATLLVVLGAVIEIHVTPRLV